MSQLLINHTYKIKDFIYEYASRIDVILSNDTNTRVCVYEFNSLNQYENKLKLISKNNEINKNYPIY